jgi:cell division inhibitor SulA
MTEILTNEQGIGEVTLLAPAMRRLAEDGQSVMLVAPPFLPFPHAWESLGIALKHLLIVRAEGKDLLWSLEQAARSGAVGMVVGWVATCRKELSYQALRRLHVAADTGDSALVLFRPAYAATEASAAPTRITACARGGELEITIIKRRAGLMTSPLSLSVFPARWGRRSLEREPGVARPPAPAHANLVPNNPLAHRQSASW